MLRITAPLFLTEAFCFASWPKRDNLRPRGGQKPFSTDLENLWLLALRDGRVHFDRGDDYRWQPDCTSNVDRRLPRTFTSCVSELSCCIWRQCLCKGNLHRQNPQNIRKCHKTLKLAGSQSDGWAGARWAFQGNDVLVLLGMTSDIALPPGNCRRTLTHILFAHTTSMILSKDERPTAITQCNLHLCDGAHPAYACRLPSEPPAFHSSGMARAMRIIYNWTILNAAWTKRVLKQMTRQMFQHVPSLPGHLLNRIPKFQALLNWGHPCQIGGTLVLCDNLLMAQWSNEPWFWRNMQSGCREGMCVICVMRVCARSLPHNCRIPLYPPFHSPPYRRARLFSHSASLLRCSQETRNPEVHIAPFRSQPVRNVKMNKWIANEYEMNTSIRPPTSLQNVVWRFATQEMGRCSIEHTQNAEKRGGLIYPHTALNCWPKLHFKEALVPRIAKTGASKLCHKAFVDPRPTDATPPSFSATCIHRARGGRGTETRHLKRAALEITSIRDKHRSVKFCGPHLIRFKPTGDNDMACWEASLIDAVLTWCKP